MPREPSFEVVETGETTPGSRLLVGIAHPGVAGVSAANYLVEHEAFDQIGHVSATGFPAIAPFDGGVPRQPMRLFASERLDVTVFVGELHVPVWAAAAFVDGFLAWAEQTGIEEIAALHGVPFPHGPGQHQVFSVATPTYTERTSVPDDVEPLAGGVLDGVVGTLVLRSLDGEAPPTCVYVTPVHPPGPDLEAALLLLGAVETACGFDVDESELRESAADLKQYYAELADRLHAVEQEQGPLPRDYPEDRMFM